MKKIVLISILILMTFMTTGCFHFLWIQYDDEVANCTTSDGKIQISMTLSRDRSTTKSDYIPDKFLKACSIIEGK